MLFRKPRVGLDINAYCGKCKTERTHTVTAMDGDIVRKVTCSMCNSTHNFKPVEPAGKEPTKRVGRPPKSGSTRKSKETEFSIDPAKPVRAYNTETGFAIGDVIRHPKFGLGSVEATYLPNKVEVRFEEGRKTLIHNMKNCR
ncbi:MAG: hypothetical protein AB1757_21760 [Acidobacteriota bacterium]